jgi:hypothetical protein
MRNYGKFMSMMALALSPVLVSPALAKVQSGTFNNTTWTAVSNIIGRRSTATVAGGGSPSYLATQPFYRSTVGLLMQYNNGDAFVCSGSLLSDRASIVTAGHCVGGAEGTPDKVTAFFYDGNSTDPVFYNNALYGGVALGVTAVDVSKIFVNPKYTGEVIDQNDIAVVRLASAPPAYATGYNLYTGTDLTGVSYNVAGYGARSDVGGAVGADLNPGRLRQGNNRFDFRLGDADFDGAFTSPDPDTPGSTNFFGGNADIAYSYIADFDGGTTRTDGSCSLAVDGFGLEYSTKYCNIGTTREVSTGGGDSGGPEFVNGQLAAVTSYGLTFGTDFDDIDDTLNDSYGELNGFVPIFLHTDFIASAVAAPEPATWTLMIAGLGLVGSAMRRRAAGSRLPA